MHNTLLLESKSPVEVVVLGDPHFGSKHQSTKIIKKALDYVMEGDHRYICTIGDNLDQSIKTKFGKIGDTLSIEDALTSFSNTFREAAKLGKFLFCIPGNHDARISDAIGSKFDPIQSLINEWNEAFKQNIQFGDPALILQVRIANFFNKNHTNFVGVFHHGAGGGSTSGAIVNASERNKNIIDNYDYAVQGHFHNATHHVSCRNEYSARHQTIVTAKQHHFTVGASTYTEGYAKAMRLRPTLPCYLKLSFAVKASANPGVFKSEFVYEDD